MVNVTSTGQNGDYVELATTTATITGPDGKTYEALYSMERQADGTWRINGCTLLPAPGLDA